MCWSGGRVYWNFVLSAQFFYKPETKTWSLLQRKKTGLIILSRLFFFFCLMCKIQPYCMHLAYSFSLLYDFQCVNIPHFDFSWKWTFGLPLGFQYFEQCSYEQTCIHLLYRCARAFLGLFGFIPNVELLGHRVYEYSVLKGNVKYFSEGAALICPPISVV